jgi:hypothetical protein
MAWDSLVSGSQSRGGCGEAELAMGGLAASSLPGQVAKVQGPRHRGWLQKKMNSVPPTSTVYSIRGQIKVILSNPNPPNRGYKIKT